MAPDFVCIGAQRSGSTWLTYNLRSHPEIWMTPVKELHFFSSNLPTPLIFHVFEKRSLSARRVHYALVRLRQPRHTLWALRYLLMPRIDRCYSWLFTPKHGQISGEATPDYAYQSIATVQRIHALLPDLKVIYLLRNPVQRLWSQFGNYMSKRPEYEDMTKSDAAIDAFIKQNFQKYYRNSNYLGNLQRWESVFRQEQFFIGFFDQIVEEPEALLTAVHAFLGVDHSAARIPATIRQPRNGRTFRRIPTATERWVTEQMYPQLTGLHERFNNQYTARWLATAEHTLQ